MMSQTKVFDYEAMFPEISLLLGKASLKIYPTQTLFPLDFMC